MYVYRVINKANDDFSFDELYYNSVLAEEEACWWNYYFECSNYVVQKYSLVLVEE